MIPVYIFNIVLGTYLFLLRLSNSWIIYINFDFGRKLSFHVLIFFYLKIFVRFQMLNNTIRKGVIDNVARKWT